MLNNLISLRPGRSLKSLLLWWIVGAGSIFALFLLVTSSLALNLGVILKLKGEMERVLSEYIIAFEQDENAIFHQDDFYKVYHSVDDIPALVKELFPPEDYGHQHFDFFVDLDYDSVEDTPADYILDICEGQPCQLLFFYSYHLPNGRWVYLLSGLEVSEDEDRERDLIQDVAMYIALLIVALFSLLALLLFRRISLPVQNLASWAEQLDIEQLQKNAPDFHFEELNLVAEKLNQAIHRTAETLDAEHRFLQYASHELRTPIAVASGNLELLEKLPGTKNLKDEEQAAIERIRCSVRDMRLLTETLLWLNRSDAIGVPKDTVDLLGLCQQTVCDNRYLLQGKLVSVDIEGERCFVEVAPVFCSILISNLIRNAFQHTQEGGVKISLAEGSLSILNWESSEPSLEKEQAGFGLGLDLVERIALRMEWQYECDISEKGRLCRLCYQNDT